jgi:hypothetical protein
MTMVVVSGYDTVRSVCNTSGLQDLVDLADGRDCVLTVKLGLCIPKRDMLVRRKYSTSRRAVGMLLNHHAAMVEVYSPHFPLMFARNRGQFWREKR